MGLSRKLAAATLLSALAVLVVVPISRADPTPQYKPFLECPYTNLEINDCVLAVWSGGSFEIGTRTIAVKNPITFQGGIAGWGPGSEFHQPKNGDTLSKTPQPMTGLLAGVTAPNWWPEPVQEWWNELIGTGLINVNATLQLAAPASSIAIDIENMVFEEGTALGLPAKIKLDNAALGSSCYIGSNAEPLQIDLTTGTSGALSGAVGELSFNEEFTIITIKGLKLVDGEFTAPEAEGCGGTNSAYVDPLVDTVFGLPSSESTATLEGVLEDASAEAIRGP